MWTVSPRFSLRWGHSRLVDRAGLRGRAEHRQQGRPVPRNREPGRRSSSDAVSPDQPALLGIGLLSSVSIGTVMVGVAVIGLAVGIASFIAFDHGMDEVRPVRDLSGDVDPRRGSAGVLVTALALAPGLGLGDGPAVIVEGLG